MRALDKLTFGVAPPPSAFQRDDLIELSDGRLARVVSVPDPMTLKVRELEPVEALAHAVCWPLLGWLS